jgi:hypothetical protein
VTHTTDQLDTETESHESNLAKLLGMTSRGLRLVRTGPSTSPGLRGSFPLLQPDDNRQY